MPKTLKKSEKVARHGKSKKIITKKKLLKQTGISNDIVTSAAPPKKVALEYLYAIGRRKSAIARVRYFNKGDGQIIINGKEYKKFFPYFEWQNIILQPLELVPSLKTGNFSIKVNGGGLRGQAESIRLGISRIIYKFDNKLKPLLRSSNLLSRDPRVKERKKYGLKKARRAPQWAKR